MPASAGSGVVAALRSGAAARVRPRAGGATSYRMAEGTGPEAERRCRRRRLGHGRDRRARLQRRRGAGGRRRRLAAGGAGRRRPGLARFNGGGGRVACRRCGGERRSRRCSARPAGAWPDRLRDAGALPPASCGAPARARRPGRPTTRSRRPGEARRSGQTPCEGEAGRHGLPASSSGPRRSANSHSRSLDEPPASRQTVAARFAAFARPGRRAGPTSRLALGGAARTRSGRRRAARCFRVLGELDSLPASRGGAGAVVVVSSEGTDLERSAASAPTASRILGGIRQFLARPKQP